MSRWVSCWRANRGKAERGKHGDRLNLLSERLGGPDAILAMHRWLSSCVAAVHAFERYLKSGSGHAFTKRHFAPSLEEWTRHHTRLLYRAQAST